MNDELNKLLESVKKLDENEYIRWEQLDISVELIDKLFDDGFVSNDYVIERLEYRNDEIDAELDTLDENDDFDSEIIVDFENEQQYNSDVIDKIENDTHVMTFGDDYEYRYVTPFMLIDYINSVINMEPKE